jgi:hypothetical protein
MLPFVRLALTTASRASLNKGLAATSQMASPITRFAMSVQARDGTAEEELASLACLPRRAESVDRRDASWSAEWHMATFLVVIGRLFRLSCNAGQTWMDRAARLLASLAVAIRIIGFIPYRG